MFIYDDDIDLIKSGEKFSRVKVALLNKSKI